MNKAFLISLERRTEVLSNQILFTNFVVSLIGTVRRSTVTRDESSRTRIG